MKKILFLGGLKPGGAEHQMVILACLLKKNGYDVTYFSTDKSEFYVNELRCAEIPLIKLSENLLVSKLKLNMMRIVLKLYRILRQEQYDTVISFLGEWNFINCLLSKLRFGRHKAITGIRNNRDEVFLNSRSKLYAKYEAQAYRKVSNSHAALRKYAHYYPSLTSKLMVIYNVVDLSPIQSSYVCRSGDKVNVIVPASYRCVKNPMKLLEALTLMTESERSRLRIDWYGNISAGQCLYNQMVDFISKHRLENTIILHDATSDIANYINTADFVALFSTSEGLPNAICEGMMLGKPVVMTRVSDYDILVDDSNGFLCDANCAKSIRSALLSIISLSENDILQMGQNSSMKANSLFTKERVLEQWKEII